MSFRIISIISPDLSEATRKDTYDRYTPYFNGLVENLATGMYGIGSESQSMLVHDYPTKRQAILTMLNIPDHYTNDQILDELELIINVI